MREVGNLSRVESSETSVRSLMSIYILDVELTVFLFRFDIEGERKRADKKDVKISAGMGKLQKELLGKQFNLEVSEMHKQRSLIDICMCKSIVKV